MNIKGDINIYRRYEVISTILLLGIFVFFFSMAVSKMLAISILLIIIISIVACLLLLKEDKKTITFLENFILFSNNEIETQIDYSNIEQIIFSNPIRHQKSITLKFKSQNKLTFRLLSGQSDKEFFEFINSKNENVESDFQKQP
jgi:hypothetical protein